MDTFILIDEKRLAVAPDKKVIKAADYTTVLDAHQLISETFRECERIEQAAQASAEAIRQKAYAEGLAKGRAAMARQMLEMVTETGTYLQEFEDRIVAMVLLSVRMIIGEIPQRDRMAAMVSQALSVVRQQQRVTLRVAPTQEEEMASQISALTSHWSGILHLDLVADVKLKPGTCVLESELGRVEASIEGQLKVLDRVLSQAFGRREESVNAQMERMKRQHNLAAESSTKRGVA